MPRLTSTLAGLSLTVLVFTFPLDAQAITEISSCGAFTWSGPAVVTADLDCGLQLTIDKFGSLDLDGHALSNVSIDCDFFVPQEGAAEDAIGRCEIVGPGSITNGHVENGMNVSVRNLTLTNGYIRGSRVSVRHCGLSNDSGRGVCQVSSEVEFGTVKITDSVLEDGECGVYAGNRVIIKNSEIRNHLEHGVTGSVPDVRAKILRSVVSNNGMSGVHAGSASISGDSSVTSNGTDPGCGTSFACADVATTERPHVGTTAECGTSYALSSGLPGTSWGVCSLD